MPPAHRAFIAHLESPSVCDTTSDGGGFHAPAAGQQHSSFLALRTLAAQGGSSLKEAYNETVLQLEKFR
jgi:hypothetical protein